MGLHRGNTSQLHAWAVHHQEGTTTRKWTLVSVVFGRNRAPAPHPQTLSIKTLILLDIPPVPRSGPSVQRLIAGKTTQTWQTLRCCSQFFLNVGVMNTAASRGC